MAEDSDDVAAANGNDWRWIAENASDIGGMSIVSAGRLYDLREHPALIARSDGVRVGFAVYRIAERWAELLALRAVPARMGHGSRLVDAVVDRARQAGADRLTVCTTNDNLGALRFYQRRAFRICRYDIGGFRAVLGLKGFDPTEVVVGQNDIVIRDVIELEMSIV